VFICASKRSSSCPDRAAAPGSQVLNHESIEGRSLGSPNRPHSPVAFPELLAAASNAPYQDSTKGTLREHQRGHARPRTASPLRPIPPPCGTFVASASRACPLVPLHRSMVRRRKREPGVLIAAARFLRTMLGPLSAAFPRRTHQLLTNVAGRSCAAPLTAPARKSAPSGWAPSNEAAKRVQDFPGERAGRMNVGR
jgi:hypothetical protein